MPLNEQLVRHNVQATLEALAASCDEFLVHGVDVEGMQLGIDDGLVQVRTLMCQ
jgi:hypothetical protein